MFHIWISIDKLNDQGFFVSSHQLKIHYFKSVQSQLMTPINGFMGLEDSLILKSNNVKSMKVHRDWGIWS